MQHSHTMEILWSAHDSIPGLIKRRLDGIKVATHPACHYCKVFPDEVTGNSENFMIPEDLLEDTGVIKTGALQREDDPLRRRLPPALRQPRRSRSAVTREKLRRLAQEEVDVCVHMCPNCAIQFDRSPQHHRGELPARSTPSCTCTCSSSSRWRSAPTPRRTAGLGSHSQDVEPLLERIGAPHLNGGVDDARRSLSLPVRRQHQRRPRPRRPRRARTHHRRRQRASPSTSSCAAPRATT